MKTGKKKTAFEISERAIAKQREDQMYKVCPELLEAKTVLIIGANEGRKMFLDDLVKRKGSHKIIVDVVEVYGPYRDYLAREYQAKKKIRNLYQYDVAKCLPGGPYDVILWYHGPEHVEKAKVADILRRLELRAKMVILGAPIGESPQGPVDGNDHQRHVSAWMPGEFGALGYKTDCLGVHGHGVNNLLAFKKA